MSFDVKVIEDSVNETTGKRITTFQLRYPRFIHAEFMTHRDFSRNASSSRAIPVAKMLAATLEDPAFFVHVGKNQPGMQANEEVGEEFQFVFKDEWEELGNIVAEYVRGWAEEYGIHKQVANRALEPWQHMQVVCTATEYTNFFELRRHKDAQPEIKCLADAMYAALHSSDSVIRPCDNSIAAWHLPYVSLDERASFPLEDLLKFSTARCARVSYLLMDGSVPNTEKDCKLYDQLVGSRPLHASPAEHQAMTTMSRGERSGNFMGWVQHRKILESNFVI